MRGLTEPAAMRSERSTISSFKRSISSDGSHFINGFFAFGTGRFSISAVLTSAKLRYILRSSGKFVNFATRVRVLYPCPLGASSRPVTVSVNIDAHASKNCKFRFFSSLRCRYDCIVYISTSELLIGVPVANVTPRSPPRSSPIYSHFKSISVARCDIALLMPATLFIFVNMNLFLYLCASSTKRASTPNCSNCNKSSFLFAFRSFSSCARLFFNVRSKSFTRIRSPRSLLASTIAVSMASISLDNRSFCLSFEIGTFSKLDIAIITASQSPVATFATKRFRLVFSKSFFVAIKRFAVGYKVLNSFAHCTTR